MEFHIKNCITCKKVNSPSKVCDLCFKVGMNSGVFPLYLCRPFDDGKLAHCLDKLFEHLNSREES